MLNSQGLLVLRNLFGDDDLSICSDPTDDEHDNGNNDENDDEEINTDDEDDAKIEDDDAAAETDDDYDNDGNMVIDEAGTPESASAGTNSAPPASAEDPEIESTADDPKMESTADSLPDAPPESQPLFFSSEESPASVAVPEPDPCPQRPSRRGLVSRHTPAPMTEPLAALRRKATTPAPIPSDRGSRDWSPISGDPPDAPPPPSDLGTFDPGSAT